MAPGKTEERKTKGVLCPGAAAEHAAPGSGLPWGDRTPAAQRLAAFSLSAAAWAPVWDFGGSLWLLSPPHGVQPFPASVYPPVSRARSVPAELMLQGVVI